MNERLPFVIERLRRKVIYSEKDFLSPSKIVSGMIQLRNLKRVDPQGLFSTEARNIFFDNYYTNPRLKTKKEINPNKLISFIYSIYSPFDPNKYETLLQIETSLLHESLLGKNTDFLEGKKVSDLITPVYVILRSLKEKDSYWLISAFKKMPYEERIRLRENVEELFEKITPFFSKEAKKKFLYSFGIDLNWLYQEPEKLYITKKEKGGVLPIMTPVKIDGAKPPEKRSGTLINRSELITDDAKIAQYLTPQDKSSPFLMPLERTADISIANGAITLGKDELSLKIFNDTLEENRLRQALQNNENLSSAFIISHFSRLKKEAHPHTSWLTNNNDEKVLTVVSSFRDCLKTIFQRKELQNLKKLMKNSFDPNLEKPDFNLFNKRVLEILFEAYRINGGNVSNIESLIKERGISESFFALRNLFFLKLLHNEMNQVSLRSDQQENFSFYSQPDNHLLFEIFQPFAKELLFFQKTGRVRGKLGHISFEDIIDLGFYFSFEKKLLSWGRTSINPLGQRSISGNLHLPPGISFSKTNFIDFQGVNMPYRLDISSKPHSIRISPIYKDDCLLSLPMM